MDMRINRITMAKSMTQVDRLPEPPTGSFRRSSPHHCYDLALQKYLLLHEQHESLRQHLDELRLSPRHSSLYTPVSPTPAAPPMALISHVDPADGQLRLPRQHSPHRAFTLPLRKGSCPIGLAAAAGGDEVAVEEAKLCDVNEGIKRALTELLNCEAVRGDPEFRTWVQCRLLDTERELRSGRRRRSAPGP